ncbi:MAG: CCA tRNA nucleotidyltransferase [Candidatus Omnitrophica bacterium]|nr:CCA tRNA nucleotidyltransferase [Candidatus Omnitrophota bacterium]
MIGQLADEEGFSAYIVGGFVRDMLLGRANLDLDIVIEGDLFRLIDLLAKKVNVSVVRHRGFGTATAIFADGFKIDFATARKESYSHPAALPGISFGSIEDDLSRRDFTINTLALQINKHNFGRLLDLFAGADDLLQGVVRVLHNASFIDDPTRIFRAIRFEQRFDFNIEKNTERLIRAALKQNMLRQLSKFRIGDEIILILKEDEPVKSLLRINKVCGSLKFIHPAIKFDKALVGQLKSAYRIIQTFQKTYTDKPLDSWLVYLSILLSALGSDSTDKICRRFCLVKKDIKKINTLKNRAKEVARALSKDINLSYVQVYKMLKPFSYEGLAVILSMTESPLAKRRINLFIKKLSKIKITLSGQDLKKLNLKPGPGYRKILEETLRAKISGKLNSKSDELRFVKERFK